MWQQSLPAFRMTLVLTVLTGLLYPGLMTGLCQVLFKPAADGSLVQRDGHTTGSALIGQRFTKPGYFHGRPSASGTDGYDAMASTGSNLGPTSQKLADRVKTDAAQFRKDNPAFSGAIPADAVTASGSGLDPDISVGTALAQAARVAEARHLSVQRVNKLVEAHTAPRTFGFMGEPVVNVLKLNLDLDSGRTE